MHNLNAAPHPASLKKFGRGVLIIFVVDGASPFPCATDVKHSI